MKILLVSATRFEVYPLLAKLKKISANETLFGYKSGKHSVDILITGVGMTATAFHLGKVLNKKYRNKFGTSYDLAINAGLAGSFKKNIPLGTIVNVASDCFGDLGAEDGEKFLTLEEMGLGKIPNPKSQVPSPRDKKAFINLPKVKGITVNTVHGNNFNIKKVARKFNPDVESMEGAAFFLACNHEKIPCVQIRVVSNYVERRNRKNWELDLAIKNLNIFLEQLLVSV